MNADTSHVAAETGEEEFESIADYHRMAADHFQAAANHHQAAAGADEDGDDAAYSRHALLAYRHQLNGVQCAEIAQMESDSLEDEFEVAAERDQELEAD